MNILDFSDSYGYSSELEVYHPDFTGSRSKGVIGF